MLFCRPAVDQEINYNGYKRKHALKYQSAVSPHGLVLHLVGPMVGSRHDNRMFKESNLSGEIQKKSDLHGIHFHAYGDQGYSSTPQIMTPFRTEHDEIERDTNKAMIPIRLPVEWVFG